MKAEGRISRGERNGKSSVSEVENSVDEFDQEAKRASNRGARLGFGAKKGGAGFDDDVQDLPVAPSLKAEKDTPDGGKAGDAEKVAKPSLERQKTADVASGDALASHDAGVSEGRGNAKKSRAGAKKTTAKPLSKRERTRRYLLAFSVAWGVMIVAYGAGYAGIVGRLGIGLSFWQILVFATLFLVPILAIWMPYWLLDEVEDAQEKQEERDHSDMIEVTHQLKMIQAHLESVKLTQEKLIVELVPLLGSKTSSQIRNRARNSAGGGYDPKLPIGGDAADGEITLNDIAHVLNFADRDQAGDWANAFALVSRNGRYLEFIRMAESVLEVFEQEGIYVEDISVRPAPGYVWAQFAQGERGDAVTALSGVRDPSVLALVRSRLRNDGAFQDLALRYQKRFIEVLEGLYEDAGDVELLALGKSRGGRLFVILGELSGVFR